MQEARKYPGEENKVIEFYQKNPEAANAVRAPIFEEKVVDHIISQCTIKDIKVSVKVSNTSDVDGEEVVLTAKEFDLLAFLSSEPGVVFRRNDILEHVWDTNWYGTTKTLDAHIASIRKKLGSPDWIQSVRGVGFKFVEIPQ